ncbi:MAG TPA: glycoside hydrolase family 38 C-terminal domain-containing protein [Gaiellaceae bacterium]|nr:glycoside hydrolase family 38 C-terminal domain-containing protein [Gaiellaceae bacterium]
MYPETAPPDELLVSPRVDRISREEAQALDYRPAELGERFGPLWATYWFRVRATVPEAWAGERVDLRWFSNSEATLWVDGRVVEGLNKHHREALLVRTADPGARLDLEVEVACNGLFGRQDAPVELHRCELGRFDARAWQLLHDFETLRALEADPGLDPSLAGELRSELTRFCNAWEQEPEPAHEILRALHERRNGSRAHEVVAMGHAHIDTAWQWPIAETKRKLARTFSTQLRSMDDYPEYRFACSQAQQYAWVEERDPDLWARLRAKVEAGQFVPVGGSWIEPDCNLPSGEALLRQFLHGQRYFESRFGVRCREFWSPDAFGYAGQLPQLMRLAGMTRFLTQKLSWNRFTRPEHHTFVWQGIDGSEVLAHFPPADTYSSEATVPELLRTAREFRDHDHSAASMLLFGHGDGGGGPTRAMLETLRRAHDLQGLPRTRQATSDEFFAALEAEEAERPVVVGELYFEYHRGTYTTQGRTKRGNRRCEQALHDAEFLACLRGGEYPRAELDRLWKLLLLNQFHDILPGSSIREVHAESERDLAEVEAGADALCRAALGADGGVPVNTVGVPRREVAERDGRLVVVEAPPYGAGRVVEASDRVSVDGLVLENGLIRAELAPDGSVTSLLHKPTGRETLAAPGNRLELYADRPVDFDAWDVDPFHLEQRRDVPPAEAWEVLTASELRAEVAFERRIGAASRLRQVVRLDAGSPRLEFHTEVDWHESHELLKACFPLAVHAPSATYEMPFGYAERPTHWSTSADAAKYEVPGHRFADLSEHGFGAALLTDSKYGYSCRGGELRVSLLRAPKHPDPEADMGAHVFAYAILPHAGGWREAGVLAEAQRFNAPPRWAEAPPGSGSFAAVERGSLVLDTIKRAEDSDALVLRLYEPFGGRGTARVRVAAPFASARLANALEEDGAELAVEDGAVVVAYRPHEVLTVKLQ